jgi:membrane protein DedA with SNARE-associated domain
MTEWIFGLIVSIGYPGIAMLMFLENAFPPLPSELIMPLAGFVAAQGGLDLGWVCLAGAVGSLAGATCWYWAGRWLGCDRLKRLCERYGRWLDITPAEIDTVDRWFDRHGGKTVFVGRLVPAVRTLISVPAGIAAMPLAQFLAYSMAGTVLWASLLAVTGFALKDRFAIVSEYVGPLSSMVIAAAVLCYVRRVITLGRSAGH